MATASRYASGIGPQVRIIAVGFVAVFGVAAAALAAPITWTFSGPVDFVYGNWVGTVPLGTPASLAVTWESSAVNVIPSCPAGSGLFPANLGATLSLLDFSVPYGGGAVEVSAPGGNCTSQLPAAVEFHLFTNVPAAPGTPSFFEILALVTPTDVHAPTLAGILANVDRGSIAVQSSLSQGGFRFQAPVQTTPEPATMVLLGLGLLIASRAARRKTRRHISDRKSADYADLG